MTTPFAFEGKKRARLAERGVQRLRKEVNTLIVIPNERLLELAGGALPFHETYRQAREVWYQSIQGINELVNAPGLVNVDFADVRTIMATGGASIIATGRARGENRAADAAEQATRSPYLDVTIDGARGVLFNVSGGAGMSLHEVTDIAALIRKRVHPDANIIFGAAIDVALEEEIQVTVIATGCGLSLEDSGLLPAIAERMVSRRQAVPVPAHYS
jgi:cell division protein FtsZ